jgi:hypothetical protein
LLAADFRPGCAEKWMGTEGCQSGHCDGFQKTVSFECFGDGFHDVILARLSFLGQFQ